MTNLANRALLVNLRISQWTARKLDKAETAEVARRHGTAAEVARVNKNLLPFAGALEDIHKKSGHIRTLYYQHTLPWGTEGINIIKTDGYIEFAQMMGHEMSEWRKLVADFIADYPSLIEQSKLFLGSLFKDSDYPTADAIAGKFHIDCTFLPVPDASDWRVELDAELQDHLKAQLTEKVRADIDSAMRGAWERVYEVVSKAHERLSDPNAIFRDSLVENARELCRILPNLNITDDPNLEAMRREVEGSLCAHDPDTLRLAKDVRASTARKMDEIMSKMGAFYGS